MKCIEIYTVSVMYIQHKYQHIISYIIYHKLSIQIYIYHIYIDEYSFDKKCEYPMYY